MSPVDARGVAYTSQNSTDTHIYGLAIALSIVQNESLIGKGLVCGSFRFVLKLTNNIEILLVKFTVLR